MSRGRHRRDGQYRDAARARCRDTWTRIRRALAWYFDVDGWRAMPAYVRALNAILLDAIGVRPKSPAPAQAAGQGPRPGDPPCGDGEVRAGDDPGRPVDYWPAYLPAPAPRAMRTRAGQAQDPAAPPSQPDAAATSTPEGGAATLPRPGLPPVAGPGQHSPWTPFQPCPGDPVTWDRADGTRVVIGWGPKAEIRSPYAQNRVTGAHVILPGPAPLVNRDYRAFEARRDQAVNS